MPEINPCPLLGGALNIGGNEDFERKVVQGTVGNDHQTFRTRQVLLNGLDEVGIEFSGSSEITLVVHRLQSMSQSLCERVQISWPGQFHDIKRALANDKGVE